MEDYYSKKLSAERLKQCYDIASPRVRQYLEAEIQCVADFVRPGATILELGCGYGRVMLALAGRAASLYGLDTSRESLQMGRHVLRHCRNCYLVLADAASPPFRNNSFDLLFCIQNGISAFGIDRRLLIEQALHLTRPGGFALFATYADDFWPHRLEWFELQSRHGLLGEIDYSATGDGVIVCKDGFRAETVGPDEFRSLTTNIKATVTLHEVDSSSLFCVIEKS